MTTNERLREIRFTHDNRKNSSWATQYHDDVGFLLARLDEVVKLAGELVGALEDCRAYEFSQADDSVCGRLLSSFLKTQRCLAELEKGE